MQRVFLPIVILIFLAFRGNAQDAIPENVGPLLTKHLCNACHAVDTIRIGPSYRQLANAGYSEKEMITLIYQPNPENWPGFPPMAPMAHLPEADVREIAKWILSLKDKNDRQ